MFNIAIPDPQGSPPYTHTFKMNEPGGTEFIFALYDAAGFNGANVRPAQSAFMSEALRRSPLTQQRSGTAMTRVVLESTFTRRVMT